jgi:hypothetical protein
MEVRRGSGKVIGRCQSWFRKLTSRIHGYLAFPMHLGRSEPGGFCRSPYRSRQLRTTRLQMLMQHQQRTERRMQARQYENAAVIGIQSPHSTLGPRAQDSIRDAHQRLGGTPA